MHTVQYTGVFTVVPAAMLLTVSFFVLFTVRKIEAGVLKVFGYVIAVFLWGAAALVLASGIADSCSMFCPMGRMMKGRMHKMMGTKGAQPMSCEKQGMAKDKMPQMMPGEKDVTAVKR